MWGSTLVEANSLQNFNFGFSTYKSDILVHLSQWQYWWWFWFSLLWAVYLFVILGLIQRRTYQFNPTINTSIRGHGKWGDFLVALIPLSWCGNILVNSNFILRMIEWQNESSLFTIRVQGKQWYWVYKYDATTVQSIMAAPKNVGNNNWVVYGSGESYCADTYYQALQLGTQLEFNQQYLTMTQDKGLSQQKLNLNLTTGVSIVANIDGVGLNDREVMGVEPAEANMQNALFTQLINVTGDTRTKEYFDYNLIEDTQDFSSNRIEVVNTKPFRVVKGVLNVHMYELLGGSLVEPTQSLVFVPQFEGNAGGTAEKPDQGELFWGFKQKKYKRVQKFKYTAGVDYDPVTLSAVGRKSTKKATYLTQKIFKEMGEDLGGNVFNYQKSIKFNRHRSELVPVSLARRLLRTKRTLVLPAHTNITVITNSYDVVHSWFIPGLGIKLDCVPGRSTHHTFYIDNVGFYYGQCAEICGRYHHHMPIRICALPFEQFLVWWQNRGLKRMHRVRTIKDSIECKSEKIHFRYQW